MNNENANIQSRLKSPLFWIGLAAAVYNAIINTGVAANVQMAWWVGAIGVGLSAILIYCNGNNPSLPGRY